MEQSTRMESIYHQSKHLLIEIEQTFQKLVLIKEETENYGIENTMEVKIAQVNTNCDRLDVMIFKLPASERQSARMRIDQLKYDVRHLQSSLQLYRDKRKRQKIEQQEREQLLSRRFVPNSNETCLDMDYALQHHDQLSSAHRGIDDLLATGGSILGSLIDQRSTLKNAKQRLMTIGSTLGLSNHTMKMIERRLSEDKYIMFGGMFGTLVIIVIVVYFIVL